MLDSERQIRYAKLCLWFGRRPVALFNSGGGRHRARATLKTCASRVAAGGGRGLNLPLSLGWVGLALGVYGTWLKGTAAALCLSGSDLGEFVKFLPAVQNGSLLVHRQAFYLPVVALVISVSLLVGSKQGRLRTAARSLLLTLAGLASLQLLPPAWSLSSIRTSEFRVQLAALGACALLLACTKWLIRLPPNLRGSLVGLVSLASAVLPADQFRMIIPEAASVYGSTPETGWGFWTTELGLILISVSALALVLRAARTTGN